MNTFIARGGAGFAALVALAIPALTSAAQVNIPIADNFFNPKETTVNLGDTVVWTNTGSAPHTVTADNGAFGSATLQPGQSFSFTFNNPGGFPYHCTFHGGSGGVGMAGRITVAAQAAVAQSGTGVSTATPSGQNTDQLRAQAQALLDQVTALQQQLIAQQGGAGQTTGSASQGVSGLAQQAGVKVVDSSACPKIGRSLKRGSKGDDVLRLQRFLARDPDIYPEGIATGYYGSLTEEAVQRWQTKFNIVSSGSPDTTGYGVVGPRTAAAISLQCSLYAGKGAGASPVGGYIQVSPISGNAPLAVNVQVTVNTTSSCAGAAYDLSWGDTTGGIRIPVAAGNCNQLSQTYSHTYQYGGIYLMKLSALGHSTTATIAVYGPGAPPPAPAAAPSPQNTSASYGALSVTPSVGGNPLAATASFDLPSSCTGYSLSWGDGTSGVTQSDGGSACASGTVQQTLSHQYAVPGSYDITLKRGPTLSKTDTASISIYQ